MTSPSPPTPLPTWKTFTIAGMSGVSSWLFVHPADVVKVRMQLMGASAGGPVSPVDAAKAVISKEGFAGLYKGLSAGVTRQAVYTTLRLGIFDELKEITGRKAGEVTVAHRAAMGLTAGGVAAFLSNPIEVCLVRMQGDGLLPKAQRRNYKGILDALLRVGKEEGVRGFWTGASPTVARAMVVSMTQLGTYDQAKEMIVPVLGDNTASHLSSAVCAAVVYSLSSLPLDTAKTRIQGQKGGDTKYTGLVQTVGKIAAEEGPRSLWKGFTPYFARCGGHTIFMFMFKELYTRLARRE